FLVSSTLLPSGVAYAEERQLTQERERLETIRQEVAESLSDVATSTQVSEDNTVSASETRAMSSEEEVSVKAETVSDPLLPSPANTEASAEVSRQEEIPEKVFPSEASDSEETSTPKRVKRSLAQSAPSSNEPLDFDSALGRYHTQLNQEELLRFQNAKTNDEKSKIIEEILIRQINEDYGLLELEAFKEQLSEEQLQLLASKETDEAFEETLKSYSLAFQQEQDLAAFMDELILSSTEEEYDKLITAKSEREFTDTLLQLSEKKVQELSPVATEGSSRRKRFAPAAPFIVMYGPQIVSAAIATGKLLAVAASAIGTAYVGHRGIEAYKNYHQAKKSAKARKSSRVHRQSRSRTNAQSRSRAVNQAKQYARSSAGYSSAYTGNTGTYVPSYGPIRPSTPVVSYGPTAPNRSARAASNVFYYTGARTIPTYNLAGDKYTVIPNDSVWSISNQFGISMTDLITWNGIQHYTIHPGQQLLVRPTVLSADGKRHQVLPNDSVWSISHKYGIAMSDFIKWNNIKNNVIHPGQNLLIRPVASAKPVSPSQPASTTTSAKTYTVKAGDSVWLIAHNHGISMDNLVKWNNIKNYTIHPGQQVIVKPATTTKAPVNTGQASPAKTYTVKAGDSVWLIAHNHGISMDDLVKWNNIKNYTIHPGQQVVVKPASPSKSSDTSQATSAKTYTVKAGDSVWLIAHNHGISMDDLIKWNHINNNLIHPGQTVIVSEAGVASSQQKDKTYTVQPGDSVWLIASIHGISMEELIALNDIKDYTIHPNQTLIVESMINKEAEKLAKELGYDKTNEFSSGRPIFKNKKKNPKFITPDNTKHKGGVWKGADKIKDLKNKTSRKGTYDKDLNKIDK
ncbi:LysM peptidoglycan-binding domain-containing protein, partial [Streptococcus pluranimalium]|uniref:LysM peptidoglycan-binding domain-containing protein n=1 Tax=Streptococcus pluranimalium TaxID=82348 RepID=UPI0039FC6797